MQQHGSSGLGDVSDPLLSNTILVVCTNSTERDGLMGMFHGIRKLLFGKASIVGMVMLDVDAMCGGKAFESLLRFNGFVTVEAGHQVDVC